MHTLFVLTAVGLILYYIINYFYQHFTFWQRQGVSAYPFISFGWATKPVFKFIDENTAKYGKIYGDYGPFSKILILNDARLVRDLSTKELHKFALRNNQFYQGTTNISKSLFFMEANEDWKRIRSILTPAFTSDKLRRMASPIKRIADNFVQHMRPRAVAGEEFDLKKYIGGFAMNVIACCGYGIELDSVRTPNHMMHPVVMNAKKIFNVDLSLSALLCFMLPQVAQWFKLETFDRDAVNYFDKSTFDIVERRIQNPDLLELMIESAKEGSQFNGNLNDKSIGQSNSKSNGHSYGPSNRHTSNGFSEKLKGISKDEMSGQGILFFIEGFDTTHATFDHAIYYLSKYPEWQEKLYQELAPIELDYDKFKSLPILNAIINESLRLNPPFTIIQRESITDCELLDTGIKILKKHSNLNSTVRNSSQSRVLPRSAGF